MSWKGPDDVEIKSFLQLVEKAGLGSDPAIQNLIQRVAATDNYHIKKELKKALTIKASQHSVTPFELESESQPVPAPMQRPISLGMTETDSLFQFQEVELTRHLLTVGQSGSGKTTLFCSLMQGLDKPFWAFDLKQDYRHLIQNRNNMMVLPWQKLKLNPLRPPQDVSPRRWAQVFSEIFGHATGLLSGSKNYLMKSIIELYRLYNLFDKVSSPYPSLHELQQLIEADKMNYVRTSSDYRDRLLNRLEAMNLTAGTTFDCSQGYQVEELLERDVVFEFDGLSRDVQNFLMEILFAYVYEYRLAQNQRDQGLNHVFFLDEGKRIFSVYKERQDASGIPEIDELTAKMREFGEGLVVADQEASKLTDSIKANTYTKVLLPTGDRKQFQAVASSMNLTERQREYAHDLSIGEAIVQVGNRDPVPVKLDNYELEKSVSDEELENRMAEKWSQLEYKEREVTREFELKVQGEEELDIPDDPTETKGLSEEAERLLEDVVENPFRSILERYQLFSSKGKGYEVKNEALNQGLVIERDVKHGPDQRKLLELTEKGREYVEEELDIEVERQGRGGIVHRYWQERIKELFKTAGWASEIEVLDADVYVNMGNTELFIEVAMGDNQREVEHVKKHLDSDGKLVWIIARNKGIQEGLRQKLEQNGLLQDRVTLHTLQSLSDPEILPR